ncbi:autophagy-related protein 13a-like isoform X1 [Typha angustifolia]|uniref:autophagy-related protein 13a-like isoform X1 n=1 Tax=Typha angustifolia TaxID=59011 RepID=UPI003C2D9330
MALLSDSGRTTEQIISQFHLKTLHAILSARIPHNYSSSPIRLGKRDRWFHLALGDPPSALEQPHGVFDPLIVDVVLSPLDDGRKSPDSIIERWVVQCEPSRDTSSNPNPLIVKKTYKKSIVLLRSLYLFLRLIPAYRLFRLLSASAPQSYNYGINYRIASFAEPFSRGEEAAMRLHCFTPVETQFGQLIVSVNYRRSLAEFRLEVSPPPPPILIADYVGSPSADPMRAFPSSFPRRADRPHSWTGAPMAIRKERFGFDDIKLSPPPFSVSPTPSPLAFGGNSMQTRLRSETMPVSIPQRVMGKGQAYRSPNYSEPTRSFLPPPSPRSMRVDHSMQGSPLESRLIRRPEVFNSNLPQKAFKDVRDDSERFSGVLSSGGSPNFGFSRSSSRLSMQDDLDDADYSYPFAVDDVDISDSQTRSADGRETPEFGHSGASSYKSQDAAVGILVQMLKRAPSLRDHCSSSQSPKSEFNGESSTSSFSMSRKTSDALRELQSYKEIKEILLSKSGTQLQ